MGEFDTTDFEAIVQQIHAQAATVYEPKPPKWETPTREGE